MNQRAPYLKGANRITAQNQAKELYLAGCTIRSVAAQMGRSYGGTRALLLEAKVKLRERGGRLRKTTA